MAKPAILTSDVKLNFKLRDFFLDLMACIVPGLIFLVAVSLIVGGLFMITSDDLMTKVTESLRREFQKDQTTVLISLLDSFTFNFWIFLLVTFLAYFAGHLLYRQSPKRPDYASFLRIRDRVMKEGAGSWVVEKGHGVKSSDVQFPYANLKNYLQERGFDYLTEYVGWDNESEKECLADQTPADGSEKAAGSRSKTIINRAKIRLAFYFPEHLINLIRNEAHIRLASSMWYAAKYTIELSYIALLLILLYLNIGNPGAFHHNRVTIVYTSALLLCLLVGKQAKYSAVRLMRKLDPKDRPEADKFEFWRFVENAALRVAAFLCWLWGDEMSRPDQGPKSEAEGSQAPDADSRKEDDEVSRKEAYARATARRIDIRWQFHDHMPLVIFAALFVSHYYEIFGIKQRSFIILYLGAVTFILIGALFSKRYIEQTIHYQRVRELVYVLETAYVAKVLGRDKLQDPFEIERFSYDIGLALKDLTPRAAEGSGGASSA